MPPGRDAKFTHTKCTWDGIHRTISIHIAVRWVRDLYSSILLVIGAMFLHNAIIWRSKAVARRDAKSHDGAHERQSALAASDSADEFHSSGHYRFALKFPDSWFAQPWAWASTCAASSIASRA